MSKKYKIPTRNGLVGEWKLDGSALDTSGNNNTGTFTNGSYATTDRGYQSQCGVFNGSTARMDATVPTQSANVNFSVSFWIKRTGTGSASNNSVVQMQNGSSARFGAWINASNQMGIWNSSGTFAYSTVVPALNVWEHWVVIRDGTNGYLYQNGQLVYTLATSSNDGAQVINAIKIGCRENNAEFFNGQVQ